MPLYEYKCGNCSYEFERLVAINVVGVQCPKCGKIYAKRKVSLIANTPAKWGENGARESLAS